MVGVGGLGLIYYLGFMVGSGDSDGWILGWGVGLMVVVVVMVMMEGFGVWFVLIVVERRLMMCRR